MNYYKRHLGDYAKKAGRLSMLQHGSYTLLIDACYDRETFPTLEQAIEWTWASTKEETEAVQFVLSKFFVLEDGLYVQKRIQEELQEYLGKAETNRRIAIERETKRKENSTNRAQDVNASSPNHKPLTNNHKESKDIAPPSSELKYSPIDVLLQAGVEKQHATDWLALRKAKKLTPTKTAIDGVMREIALCNMTPAAAIKLACENNWGGFKAAWAQNIKPVSAEPKQDPRFAGAK